MPFVKTNKIGTPKKSNGRRSGKLFQLELDRHSFEIHTSNFQIFHCLGIKRERPKHSLRIGLVTLVLVDQRRSSEEVMLLW